MAVTFPCLTMSLLLIVVVRAALIQGHDRVLTINDVNVARTEIEIPRPLTQNPNDGEGGRVPSEIKVFHSKEQTRKRTWGERKKRKAIRPLRYRWPDAVVPYKIGKKFSTEDIKVIKKAMNEFSRHTCLKFRKALPTDKDKIVFKDGDRCSSKVGRIGGTQIVTLDKGRRWINAVLHELGHVIGFTHEHLRPDRNDFVIVHKGNILDKHRENFARKKASKVDTYGIHYDYQSIMHYEYKDFSKNGKQTITAINTWFTKKLGVVTGLSFRDVKLVNLMYTCARRNNCGKIQCNGVAFVGTHCNCKCPSPRGDKRPTVDCPAKMEFMVRSTCRFKYPLKNKHIEVVCAYPGCADYKLSRKGRGTMPKIPYMKTALSYQHYGGKANVQDKILYFTIEPIRCHDSGIYVCSCQPRKGGPRMSATWHARVRGCKK